MRFNIRIRREALTVTSKPTMFWSRCMTTSPDPKMIDFGVAKAIAQSLTEQTLAKYVYSLQPPANPHVLDELAERGQKVFMSNGCANCHQPDQNYGSDRLVAAPGFEVPVDHPEKSRVMSRRVNTDSTLTMSTRRGTGFYKVPSLRSVWMRGPFEHSGSVATLEDWFDPKRLEDDYVPTGWKGPTKSESRAVKGHPFGLHLEPDEKSALIAFLKSL